MRISVVFFLLSSLAFATSSKKEIESRIIVPKHLKTFKKEVVVADEKATDGSVCTNGIAFQDTVKGTHVFLTLRDFVKKTGNQKEFDGLLESALASNKTGMEIERLLRIFYCDGAGFNFHEFVGSMVDPLVDRAVLMVAEHGQEECGQTELVLFAKSKKRYFMIRRGLDESLKKAGCKLQTATDDECDKKTQCVKTWVADTVNQEALREEMYKILHETFAKK